MDFRHGRERNAYYWVGDKKILRVTIPKEHSGSSLSLRVAKRVINDLRLTNDEFYSLYKCPMSGTAYKHKIEHLIQSGEL